MKRKILRTTEIDKDSSSSSDVTFGECNIWLLLFADDLALLSSNKSDLHYALGRSSDACLDAEMKISTTKTEIMCLSRHPPVFFPNKWSNSPADGEA